MTIAIKNLNHPNIYQDFLTEKVQQMTKPKTHLIMDSGQFQISRLTLEHINHLTLEGHWYRVTGTYELNEDLNLWIARPDGMDGQAARLHSKTFSGLKQAIRREFDKMIKRDTVS